MSVVGGIWQSWFSFPEHTIAQTGESGHNEQMIATAHGLISADSHINEAPDLWEARLPARLRDRGPRLVHTDDGQDVWLAEGLNPMPLMWATNAAGQRREGEAFDDHEMTIGRDEMIRGSYDPVARVADMEADGLDAEVLYPGHSGGWAGAGASPPFPTTSSER